MVGQLDQQQRDIVAIGGYGMRRRNTGNAPNDANNRNDIQQNQERERRNLDDAAVAAANVPNVPNVAQPVVPPAGQVPPAAAGGAVDAADDQNAGFLFWLIGALNVNILIRMGMFMWFFGSHLNSYRYYGVCVAITLYYLHQIGFLRYMMGNRQLWGRRNVNEPQHRDPNAAENADEVVPPPRPLSYVELIQRGLIGFALSLWPTWDHRQMYPQPVRR